MERNAYNAAFHELGFRWHWDSDTYNQLVHQCSNAGQQIRQYLETRQPHLLKAYDAAFLIDVIQEKKARHGETQHCFWRRVGIFQLGGIARLRTWRMKLARQHFNPSPY